MDENIRVEVLTQLLVLYSIDIKFSEVHLSLVTHFSRV